MVPGLVTLVSAPVEFDLPQGPLELFPADVRGGGPGRRHRPVPGRMPRVAVRQVRQLGDGRVLEKVAGAEVEAGRLAA